MLTDNREDDGEKKEKDRESGRKRRSAVKIKTKQRERRREEIYHTQSGGRASVRLRTCGVAYRISFFNPALCTDKVRKTHNSPTEATAAALASFSFSSRTACSISSVLFCHLHNSFPVWVLFLETPFLSRCHIKKCRKRHKMRAGANS